MKRPKRKIGEVTIDGVLPASQFHLLTRKFTDAERAMIFYAISPTTGLIDIQTVDMRRIIVTTNVFDDYQKETVEAYAKIINQVLNREWLWETNKKFTIGKRFDDLPFQSQKIIIEQYPPPDMNNHKCLLWWKADSKDSINKAIIAHLRRSFDRHDDIVLKGDVSQTGLSRSNL